MPGPSLIVIGRPEGATLARLVDGDALHVRHAEDLDAAARMLADGGDPPELIVLVQSRPGEFSAAEIDGLRRLAPLARVWRLLGTWCEGEARSGQPPSGCTSIYWHQWPARWARERARWQDGLAVSWSAPMTSSADERALAAADEPIERGSGLIVICARHRETAAALAEVCKLAGYQTQIMRAGQDSEVLGASAILWETDAEQIGDASAIRTVRASVPGDAVPLVAVVTFPRVEDVLRAAEAGVAAVVSKPFLVQDLLSHLAQWTSASDRLGT